jgi:hypothetical protein
VPLVGFKTVTAGNASQPSGAYTYYWDANGGDLGTQSPADNAESFTDLQECRATCDAAPLCAGIQVFNTVDACMLIFGDPVMRTEGGVSFVRADTTRLQVPT